MKMKNKKYLAALFVAGCGLMTLNSCSDSYLEDVNTDSTKTLTTDPNGQLTTTLLQTYGDFSMMDTYRSYITGFTQHFAGGWNVSRYAGSVHYEDDQARLVWDRLYTVAIKNLRDAINNSADRPNVNAALRIHRVYLMSVLTDIYGDVPCMSIAEGLDKDISTPSYDRQEDIYNWFFEELEACVAQLGTGNDAITGDVTNYLGDEDMWKKYANSLRMRFAMRISDVNEDKAKAVFKEVVADKENYISSSKEDAYIKYVNSPFTLYAGANEFDFRVNALGEMLYGQDSQSPSFVSSTFVEYMKENNDPRLYKICRHYMNITRSEIKPDKIGNKDMTDDVVAYLTKNGKEESPCDPGYAWYSNPWLSAPALSELPELEKLDKQFPEVGYSKNNYPERMMRPMLSIDFEMADRPGILMTYAEVEFLLAEAASKGWIDSNTTVEHYKKGTEEALRHLNKYYLESDEVITEEEITTYVNQMAAKSDLVSKEGAREAINLQAWILHMMNPSEGWANLRRSDYPTILDRTKLPSYNWTIDDKAHMETPMRLRYPVSDRNYNSVNYDEAVSRMGTKNEKGEYIDDWHKPVWWDKDYYHVK